VLPVDAEFSQVRAMAIRGNKVLAIGSQADVMKAAGPNAKVNDVSSKTILPCFIEPHMRFALLGAIGHWRDLGVRHYATMPDAMAALKKIAKATPAGQWIEARQIEPSLQGRLEVQRRPGTLAALLTAARLPAPCGGVQGLSDARAPARPGKVGHLNTVMGGLDTERRARASHG